MLYVLTLLLLVGLLTALGSALIGIVWETEEADIGAGAALGLILHAYSLFLLSSLGVLYNSAFSGWLLIVLLAGLVFALGGLEWWSKALRKWSWRQTISCLGLATVYLGYCWIRSNNPQIWGEEKFMDFAFVNGIWRSEYFPPSDPWFAGGTINYYYFGYLIVADLARLSGIPTAYLYNMALGLWFAISFALAFEIGHRMTGRSLFGILAALLLTVCGNLDGAIQIFNGKANEFNYFQSSRIIEFTINEFPFFSFIHADLHPHVLAIPLVLLLLDGLSRFFPRPALLFPERWLSRPVLGRLLVLAVLLGAVPATNIADLPTFYGLYALGLGGLLLLHFRDHRGKVLQFIGAFALVFIAARLLYFPFHSHFQSAQIKIQWNSAEQKLEGIGWVQKRTDFLDFLIIHALFFWVILAELFTRASLFGGKRSWKEMEPWVLLLGAIALVTGLAFDSLLLAFLLVCLIALGRAWIRSGLPPEEHLANLFLLVGLGLLSMCELIYVQDFYSGDYSRHNTVFKFYYQVWFMLSFVTAWALPRVWSRTTDSNPWRLWKFGFIGLLAAMLVYPIFGTRARYYQETPAGTLYGMDHLVRWHADEHEAMLWLQKNAPRDARLLEMPGGPYSYFGRFSANTGIPTLLGWTQHEAFWRDNTYKIPREREEQARSIYQATSWTPEVRKLLGDFRVRYIVVGEQESKELNEATLAKFKELPVAFEKGQVKIYEWKPSA